jgi:DNA-binding MarR family transcriptional regulator
MPIEEAALSRRQTNKTFSKKGWFRDTNSIFDDRALSPYAMLVRLYLARCANEDRLAWPSATTIAEHCNISKSSAIRAVKELESVGWIRREKRKRENGSYSSTMYYLLDKVDAIQRQKELRIKELRAMPYEEYLKTPEWQATRARMLKLAGYRCQVCNGKHNGLNVHHRTYERLGEERDSDLVVLCLLCHQMFHDNGKIVGPRHNTYKGCAS